MAIAGAFPCAEAVEKAHILYLRFNMISMDSLRHMG